MEKKGLLIFDFDGVIVDSMEIMFANMEKYNPGLSWDVFKEVSKFPVEERDALLRKKYTYNPKVKESEFYKEYPEKKKLHSPLHSGMEDVLPKLKNSYILMVNTNAYSEVTKDILTFLKVEECFDEVFGRELNTDKVEKSKEMIKRTEIDLKKVLFLTDTLGDVRDARDTGIKVIATTWGVHERNDFETPEFKETIFRIVDTSKELEQAVEDYFKDAG